MTSVGVVPDSSDSSSSVTYPVIVSLDEPASRARVGMTAAVRIVTARGSGLVIPSEALRGSMATVVRNGRRTTARVDTGVVGDQSTIVTDGLSAGDEVIETSASATAGANASASGADTTSNSSASLGGGALAGGGFRAGGGPPSAP
ncbi:MAG: hypothetical protein ACXW08_09230 [Solirubrobacteraceae bacterium]